jgi:Uma2 family endonuclease
MLAGNGERTLREMADELLEFQRVEFIHDGGLTFVATPGRTHRTIVTRMTEAFSDAWYTKRTRARWDISAGDFQFEWNDVERHFCVPDLAIAYPGTTSNAEFRENLVMVVEVTSPKSRDTVGNDFEVKYKQYAKGGVPLYLLVDQEHSAWHLYALMGQWPGYQVYAEGGYGEPIELPEPFGFDLPTQPWPRYSSKDD